MHLRKDPCTERDQPLVHRAWDEMGGTHIKAMWNKSEARTTHYGLYCIATNFSNSAQQRVGICSSRDLPCTPIAPNVLVRFSKVDPRACTCRRSCAMAGSVGVGGGAVGAGLTNCLPGLSSRTPLRAQHYTAACKRSARFPEY